MSRADAIKSGGRFNLFRTENRALLYREIIYEGRKLWI